MEAWDAVVSAIRESEPTEATPEEKYMLGTPHMALSETFRRRPNDPNAVEPESDPKQYVTQKSINTYITRERYTRQRASPRRMKTRMPNAGGSWTERLPR